MSTFYDYISNERRKVRKVGTSFVTTIPKRWADYHHLKNGDVLDIKITEKKITITVPSEKK